MMQIQHQGGRGEGVDDMMLEASVGISLGKTTGGLMEGEVVVYELLLEIC
jgi:hypothetical protein